MLVMSSEKANPSFNYDLEIFRLCQKYIKDKNHHGLALIARQKGLPPFLRYKIWPILLKYHPYVIKPSIQPDNLQKKSDTSESEGKDEEELLAKIEKDLLKYLMRLKNTTQHFDLNSNESQVFAILKSAIRKFICKWGKIIKYDSALTWIALGLAEWYPPIPGTSWVLVGRDIPGKGMKMSVIKSVFEDYTNYIGNLNLSDDDSDGLESNPSNNELNNPVEHNNMLFHEVYERLVLVLLHCPNNKLKPGQDFKKFDMTNEKMFNLPKDGGSIEERVTFFIYLFRKLLPELSSYFNEEQLLKTFGSNDDEWLIWWLKYCGSKVWSRVDRGKIWDLLIGFKFKSKDKNYNSTLQLTEGQLGKIGNDNFWSFSPSVSASSTSLTDLSYTSLDNHDVPFPKINPHIQLLFITLALLKSKENVLMELDQHEIRQYLSRLPSNSYNLSNKYQIFKQKIDKKREEQQKQLTSTKNSRSSTISDLSDIKSSPDSPLSRHSTATSFSTSPVLGSDNQIISNDSLNNHSIDFMDNIINEAGELWRKWLWLETSY